MRPTQEELEDRNILKSKFALLVAVSFNYDQQLKIPRTIHYFKAKFKRNINFNIINFSEIEVLKIIYILIRNNMSVIEYIFCFTKSRIKF